MGVKTLLAHSHFHIHVLCKTVSVLRHRDGVSLCVSSWTRERHLILFANGLFLPGGVPVPFKRITFTFLVIIPSVYILVFELRFISHPTIHYTYPYPCVSSSAIYGNTSYHSRIPEIIPAFQMANVGVSDCLFAFSRSEKRLNY